ncbi:hypothetical protein ACS3UN_03995 [Oscillospiraceae bacterium LTW-04]|nr:ferritin-like domain-containing protein [Oscillospiraceae bacterium MB24-C1]
MDLTLPQQLQEYIEFEMNCDAFYRTMAEIAPTDQERQVFLEIADNRRHHVQLFQDIYVSIAGENYEPPAYSPDMDQPYQFALRHLILSEHKSFQEYHNQFMNTDNNALKKACYQVGLNKTEHINKLMTLMIDKRND